MANILLVEDEANARKVLTLNLTAGGHVITACANPEQAKVFLEQQHFDVVITDLHMDDDKHAGIDVVRMATQLCPQANTLLLTAYASAETAVEAMRQGAFDYLTKPVSGDEINAAVERALLAVKHDDHEEIFKQTKVKPQDDDVKSLLIGKSHVMQRVRDRLKRAAAHDFTVLISGESGTGKELAARFVHACANSGNAPFVPVHCGAIPEGLFESELFGHCKGAFTGADTKRVGLIESARGGTLFLDEIGEMPMSIQVKLLRVLQEKRYRHVGDDIEKDADVRVVAASNRDLQEAVGQGYFREDLFYRLNVVPIHIPPLRSRREDIPELVEALVKRIHEDIIIPDACMKRLVQLPLLGNVRELENLLQRLIALSDGNTLDISLLDEFYQGSETQDVSLQVLQKKEMDLDTFLESVEKKLVCDAMGEAGGNATQAAKLLGINFRSIRYRLQKLGIKD